MQVELNYGRDKLPVDLPERLEVRVVHKPAMPVLSDPQAEVLKALAEPVGTAPLTELAGNARSAAIAICDITRPVPNSLFLRPLIHTLIKAGIGAQNIVVLVATGLHRPNLGTELERLIGDPWVLGTVRVENHFATNDKDHLFAGYDQNPRHGRASR